MRLGVRQDAPSGAPAPLGRWSDRGRPLEGEGAPRAATGESRIVRDDPDNLTPAKFEVKTSVANWLSLFSTYRVLVIRNDEVVRGILHPELGPDPHWVCPRGCGVVAPLGAL